MRHFADNNGLVRFCWFSSVCCAGFSRDSHHAACPARWSARLFDGATGIWCLAQAALVFLSWQVGNLLENTEDAQGANYLQEGLRLAFSFAMIFQNLTLRLSTSITQLPPFGPFTCTSAVTTCDNSLSQLQAYALQQLCLECPGCGPRTSGPVARSFGVAEPRWLGILRYGKIANGWTFGVQSLQPWAQRDTMALVCTCSDVHGKWNRLFRTKRELEFRKWRFPDLNSTHVWFHFYFSRLASWTRKSRHLEQHGNDLCIWAGQCQGKGYNWQKKLWTHQEPKITGSLKVSLRSMDIMDLIDSRLMKHYETIWNHMKPYAGGGTFPPAPGHSHLLQPERLLSRPHRPWGKPCDWTLRIQQWPTMCKRSVVERRTTRNAHSTFGFLIFWYICCFFHVLSHGFT